jgi:hypothetical protein
MQQTANGYKKISNFFPTSKASPRRILAEEEHGRTVPKKQEPSKKSWEGSEWTVHVWLSLLASCWKWLAGRWNGHGGERESVESATCKKHAQQPPKPSCSRSQKEKARARVH